MGTTIGHVLPGVGFLLIGLWHLFNHTKLFVTNGADAYISLIWFPSSSRRHVELYVIMFCCTCSLTMELVLSPSGHTLFDTDGSIASSHLRNLEHASISLTFFVYAAFALAFDKLVGPASHQHDKIVQMTCGVAFAQQLLLFHLHATDHMGVEGHYHWLLQLIVAVSLGTTLLGIAWPKSFVISYVRSVSVAFQGIWLVVMGLMLWTPGLIPKGCFLNSEDGHKVMRCKGDEPLHRAKSLVNIEFSWFLIGIFVFATSFYLFMVWVYGLGVHYVCVVQEEEVDRELQAKALGKTNSLDDMEM